MKIQEPFPKLPGKQTTEWRWRKSVSAHRLAALLR
nr:MAG TPA: hypothetical protein [Caudoviricetes sp.]